MRFEGRAGRWGVALLAAALACSREPPPQAAGPRFGAAPSAEVVPTCVLAIHPLHNPARLLATYEPLAAWLNRRLKGCRVRVEASRDYAAFEAKVRERKPELILPNPWQALQAMASGYRVVAMAGEPGDFRGIFLARRDSRLRRPEELKGASVAYPSRTALAACIMPQWFLHTHGIDVGADLDNRYVGSQESAILNAHQGLTAVAATWPQPWRAFQRDHPAEAAELEVLWETEPLVNNAVMVRNDVPAGVAAELGRLLVELDRNPDGRALLASLEIARFLPATDADYEVVRRYVERFEREVRPVEGR